MELALPSLAREAAPPGAALAPADVILAVIIPSYRQPALMAEAIEAVLRQQDAPPTAIVVVDDGCPFEDTSAIAFGYAAAHPGRVYPLRRRNGGLSAARNTGIEFALAAFPNGRALYLLDADNRLHPPFLARAFAALEEAPPRVGWLYPDFDMFGEVANYSNRGPYSLLSHLSHNYCEAGSLVRRGVFEGGLRFDESLKQGFEDWDFWLQAAGAGWRGQHLPHSGFQYRRRPESMLREAERGRDALLNTLRRKHAALFRPRRLLELEAEEAPRFALYMADHGSVRFLLDPDEAHAPDLLPQEARRRWLSAQESPRAHYFPSICGFVEDGALALLRRLGLARGVFWHAQRLLRHNQFVAVELALSPKPEIAVQELPAAGHVAQAPMIFATTAILSACARDSSPHWLETIASATPHPKVALLRITLPQALATRITPSGTPLRQLLLEVAAMGRSLQGRSRLPVEWREDPRPPRSDMAQHAAQIASLGVTLPRRPERGRREIGFVLPLVSFGGVERAVLNQAAVFRAAGWRTHLVVAGANQVAVLSGLVEAFDSITLFAGLGEDQVEWNGGGYFGAGQTRFGEQPGALDALGLLAGFDVVVNTHSAAGHALMAQARRGGTRTYAALHVTDQGAWGEPAGVPFMVMAYEHAYDGVTVISEQMRGWCIGQGLPAEKLHLVRNAPGTALAPRRRAALLAARERRQKAGGPLRVLFLGRLDPQKGLDRLAAIMARAHGPDVQWRIVGKRVLSDHPSPEFRVPVEPPVTAPEQLDSLYAWADVVVMPSRFEGVPLTVLEAQRLGCAVIATDVGAVAEVIRHGEDGWLVDHRQPEDAIVTSFCTLLDAVATPRSRLLSVGAAAAHRVACADWSANLAPFLDHLEAALAADEAR